MTIKQDLRLTTGHTQNCLPLLGMAYVIFILTGFLFVAKEVQIRYLGIVSAGAFVLPVSFVIIDIIAEAYGYMNARRIIIYGIIIQGLFCLLCYILLHISSPVTNAQFASPASYQKIFGGLPKIYISTTIASILSSFLNAYLLTRWQFICKGKYFWLRSIGASGIGEGVFTLIAVLLISLGQYSASIIFQFFAISYLAKIITTIICAYPASLILIILRKYEFLDFMQNISKFDPFKSSPKEEKEC